jgi:hypothetical protein
MLYVMRCAVYSASEYPHDPDKLLWWNWKDPALAGNRKKPVPAAGKQGE